MQLNELAAPWPSYETLLAVNRTTLLNVGRRLRLGWALHRTRQYRGAVNDAVARCPWVRQTLSNNPILFRPLMVGFLDLRWSRVRQFEAYAADLRFTSTYIHSALPGFFPNRLRECLWKNASHQYAVYLDLNLDHPQEGLWRLSLSSPNHPRLFSISFSIIPGPTLFIGSVQGGRTSEASDVVQLIRDSTKAHEGMRPQFLLFDAIRALAANWNVASIVGIASRYQLTARIKGERSGAVKFSYDEFFTALGGVRSAEDNWALSLISTERSIAATPSRKRAMYRRRALLVSQLRSAVGDKLSLYP